MSEHQFAQYVRILGKGKSGSRSLSIEEAEQAFSMILNGEAEPEQVGAFLMLLRVKEESPEEIAGFIKACKAYIQAPTDFAIDIDWSSYAGKRKQLPWFLPSIAILAENGYRIFIHGAKGHTEGRLYTEDACNALGIPVRKTFSDAKKALTECNICFMPIKDLCEPLNKLIGLRSLLGLRSPVHTLCRLINPCEAPISFSSIFHPAYATIHQHASKLLAQPKMAVFKGESGEVERKPDATCLIKTVVNGEVNEQKWARLQTDKQNAINSFDLDLIKQLYQGKAAHDYGEQAIIGTLAIALALIDSLDEQSAMNKAHTLWQNRNTNNPFFQ